jgi:sulfur carrier protein
VVRDLGIEQGKKPNYAMVTGTVVFQRGTAARAVPALCAVYVADANTGNFAAYGLPWDRTAARSGSSAARHICPLRRRQGTRPGNPRMSPSEKSSSAMNIHLNGQPRDIPARCTVADLLVEMQLESRMVAVEVNLHGGARAQHGQHVLHEGDRLEIVTLVGGG